MFSKPTLSLVLPLISCLVVAAVIACSKLYVRRRSSPPGRLAKVLETCQPFGRSVVYSAAFIWAAVLYVLAANQYQETEPALSELMRNYGLSALFLLFAAYVPGIVGAHFPQAPIKGFLFQLRRSFGVSAFMFALLHAGIGFTHNLSASMNALAYLPTRHKFAISFALVAFGILLLMAATSFDRAWEVLGKWCKRLHRFIYLAGLLVLAHVILIGSDFTRLTSWLPALVLSIALTIMLLEIVATLRKLHALKKLDRLGGRIFAGLLVALLLAAPITVGSLLRASSYDPHAQHRGNASSAYAVTLTSTPERPPVGEPVELRLQVTNRSSGQTVTDFRLYQERLMHVIMVGSDLRNYQHLHPEHDGAGSFTVPVEFPEDGTYTVYAEFAPATEKPGAEVLAAASISTANAMPNPARAELAEQRSAHLPSNIGVDLDQTGRLRAGQAVDMNFTFTGHADGQPVRTLEPYLGAFGHLAAISQDLATFTHVHPLGSSEPGQTGGPVVSYSVLFPAAGSYKLFLQFKLAGELQVAEFVVEVQP